MKPRISNSNLLKLSMRIAISTCAVSTSLAEPVPTARIDHPIFAGNLGGQHLWSHQYSDGSGYETLAKLHFDRAESLVELRWRGLYSPDFSDAEIAEVREPVLVPDTDMWRIQILADRFGQPGQELFSASIPSEEVRVSEIGLAAWTGNMSPQFEFQHPLATPFEMEADTTFWLSILSITEDVDGAVFAIAAGSSGEVAVTGHLEMAATDARADSTTRQRRLESGSAGSLGTTDGLGARAVTLLTIPLDDADADGLDDEWETQHGLEVGRDDAFEDPDGDGLTNLREFERRTQPNHADIDGDGLSDAVETGTGIYIDENDRGTSPNHADSDGDGLADNVEVPTQPYGGLTQTGTHPLMPDTDFDGLNDREEITEHKTNPSAIDTDGDSISDQWEVTHQTNPNNAASPADVILEESGDPLETWHQLEQLPTFGGYDTADVQNIDQRDATFMVSIDFDAKPAGEREVIFETGGGRVGHSIAYEAGNNLVLRAVGDFGNRLAYIEGTLRDEWIAAGEIDVIWSIDVRNSERTQTVSLWVDGTPISEVQEDLGGDWSGNNGAAFGVGGTRIAATGLGSAGISGIDFTSGKINLTKGLRYFNSLPIIDSIQLIPLQIKEIRFDSGAVTVKWASHAGKTYTLEHSSNLESWIEIDDGIESGGEETTFEDNDPERIGSREGYYRVSDED